MGAVDSGIDLVLFEEWLRKQSTKLNDSTITIYLGIVKKFLNTNPNVNELNSYNNFLIELRNKQIYTHYYALKYYINYKVEDKQKRDEILKYLIKQKLGDPKINKRRLTDTEIFQVISKLKKKKHKIIAKLQYECGLRSSDCFWLTEDSVFEEREKGRDIIRLRIFGKGNKYSDTFIFNERLQEELKQYIKEHPQGTGDLLDRTTTSEYIFRRDKNIVERKKNSPFASMRRQYLRYWLDLKQALNTCKINPNSWSTHDFRRNFAIRCYEMFDRDIYRLKEALRHSDINTTARYLKFAGLDVKDTVGKMQTKKVRVVEEGYIDGTKKDDVVVVDDLDPKMINRLISNGILEWV